MRVVAFALLAACGQAGEIAVTWADCGDASTHGTITDLQPTSISTGSDQTITGSGSVDEDVSGGTFTFKVKAGWVTVLDDSGDICQPKSMVIKALGITLGTVSWGGLSCPVAHGALSVPIVINLSNNIPTSLARTTMDATATGTNGDKLLCLSTSTAPATEMSMVAAQSEIAVTWADCGDANTHGTITDVEPTTISTGSDQTITGSGSLDEDVSGGTFTFKVKAGWVTVLNDSGDICQPKSMVIKALGMTLGTVSWGGLSCPVAHGALAVPIVINLSSNIPTSLARTTMDATATGTNGDKLLCLSTSTAPAMSSVIV